MKNVQTFNEFVNESKIVNEGKLANDGESIAELQAEFGEDDGMDQIYDTICKALKCSIGDLYQVHTEMDDSDAYEAAEMEFQSGPSKPLKVEGSSVGGPFLSVNTKAGICQFDDYGMTSFIYNKKKAKF